MAKRILTEPRLCVKCGTFERNARGKCKLCTKITKAVWYSANADKAKNDAKAWKSVNTEKEKARHITWNAANPGRSKATTTAWCKAHPDVVILRSQNRRAKVRSSGGRLSAGLAQNLFKLQKGKCPCCGKSLGSNYHLDHKMPLALGGSNTDDNMQLLRSTCNLQKNAKHPIDFMQSRGFLL